METLPGPQNWKSNLNLTKRVAKIYILERYNIPYKYLHRQPGHTIFQRNRKYVLVKFLGVFIVENLTWNIHIILKLAQAYSRVRNIYPSVNFKSNHPPFYTFQ